MALIGLADILADYLAGVYDSGLVFCVDGGHVDGLDVCLNFDLGGGLNDCIGNLLFKFHQEQISRCLRLHIKTLRRGSGLV